MFTLSAAKYLIDLEALNHLEEITAPVSLHGNNGKECFKNFCVICCICRIKKLKLHTLIV
jgi:hypothetical protein